MGFEVYPGSRLVLTGAINGQEEEEIESRQKDEETKQEDDEATEEDDKATEKDEKSRREGHEGGQIGCSAN
jgi:hypothetical protein